MTNEHMKTCVSMSGMKSAKMSACDMYSNRLFLNLLANTTKQNN